MVGGMDVLVLVGGFGVIGVLVGVRVMVGGTGVLVIVGVSDGFSVLVGVDVLVGGTGVFVGTCVAVAVAGAAVLVANGFGGG